MKHMKYYLSFDVESVGLFGPPFAFGYCVVDETGKEHESGIHGWDYRPLVDLFQKLLQDNPDPQWTFTKEDQEWVAKNVIPGLPEGWANWENLNQFCSSIYDFVWCRIVQEYKPLTFVTDCPFPVEANFVNEMLRVMSHRSMKYSPYPLVDVGSMMLARGYDPLKTYPRKENELPAHNPVNDARQSVRQMLELLKGRFRPTEGKEVGSHGQIFCPYCGFPLKIERPPGDGNNSTGYMCTNDHCTWSLGGLIFHHSYDAGEGIEDCRGLSRFRRSPGIDFWSLSYVK